jgi:hypothetical protein
MPSHGVRHTLPSNIQPSNIPSSITPEGRRYLHELSQRASNISKDQAFLGNTKPSISRINSHRHSCASSRFSGGNCSCNGGAYTFADVDDLEAQLLKSESGQQDGLKSIQRVTPGTAQGLANIKTVFSTRNSAADSLEDFVSIGDVAPGEAPLRAPWRIGAAS